MRKKRNLETASDREADPMNQGETQGETFESLQQDAEESPALLSRYNFEIRVGLGVLGVLGFIFAAVVAYRMVKLRQNEVSGSKSTETAQMATENESKTTTGSTPQVQEQQPARESLPTPPAFSLDFPNESGLSSAQSAPSAIEAANNGAYSSPPGSAWAIPSETPPATPSAENTPSGPKSGAGFSGDYAGMAGPYASLSPAAPVGNPSPTGVPGVSFSPNPAPQGAVPPSASGNSQVRDFFSDGNAALRPSETPGFPSGTGDFGSQRPLPSQASVSSQSSAASSGSPFPGDFFSGATPVSPGESAAVLPSASAQRANETVPSTRFDGTARDTRQDSSIPSAPPFDTGNTALGGQFSGLPRSSGESGQNLAPYTPPLVASGSNVTARINSDENNYVMYTVQEGETLFDIARQRLGKASRWVDIYQLNRAQLGERLEHFRPGLTLRLPPEGIPPAAASPSTLR